MLNNIKKVGEFLYANSCIVCQGSSSVCFMDVIFAIYFFVDKNNNDRKILNEYTTQFININQKTVKTYS